MSLFDRLRQCKKNPTPTSPWDMHDIEACLARGDDVCDQYIEGPNESLSGLQQIMDEFLSEDRRPAADQPFLWLVTFGQGNLLVFPGNEQVEAYVPIFTSPFRADLYCRVEMGTSAEPRLVGYVPGKVVEIGALAGQGLNWFVLDRCPYCPIAHIFKMECLRSLKETLKVWAIAMATRAQLFDKLLSVARTKLDQGQVESAQEIGEHIVTHVDAERPEVHLLLGECGVLRKDPSLVSRKQRLLGLFGPEWVSMLK